LGGCGGAQSRFDAHMKRGQEYFAADDYSRASVEFRNAMQIEPRNAAARIMAARTFEKQTKLREAIGLYQSAVDLAPDNSEASANLARLLIFAGAAEQATKILEPALKRHPDDPLLLTLRGAARQQLGRQAEGIVDVDRALKLDPNNTEAIEARAGMYRHAGDFAAATALVGAAVARAPNSVELHEALADLYLTQAEQVKGEAELRRLVELQPREPRRRYQLASFYVRAQRLDEAQKVLEEAVKALPTNNDVKLALVEFIGTQRTRVQGEQLLRDFIAHDPGNGELRLGLGQLLQRSGALPEAIAVYQDVAERDRTGPQGLVARERLARISWTQGRLADAEKLVAQVLETSPHDNEALLLRAEMALARADARAAITDLRAVLRDQPQAVGVYRLLASALAQTGDTALAEESLRTAINLAPADSGLRVELAKVLLQAQRADQAVTVLEEAAQRAPADLAVREELATAYLVRRDYAAARTAAADLEQLRPESAAGPYIAGLAAEGLKQPDVAQKSFKRALALEPRSFDALAALSQLMVSRGEVAQAVAQVRSVADHGPSPPDAHVLNLLGELYLAQHNVPLAVDALSRASAAAPTWWIPDRNLALAKLAARDQPGAIAAYQAGIKAAPGEAQPVMELAAFYESHGRAGDAIALYQDAYGRNRHSQPIANNLALLLVRYRTDQASLDQARDLSAPFSTSTDGRLLDTNGWVHFKRAEYAQALPVLQRAVERQPDSPEIRYHLGMAEWRSGNTTGARKDLEAALAGSAQFTGANEARVALASLSNSSG
jgi:tetratricopeptide (TPR) repeat protein